MTGEVIAFLRARLAEGDPFIAENKNTLIDIYEDSVRDLLARPTEVNLSRMEALRYTVHVLAEGFDAHPDYREEWRP